MLRFLANESEIRNALSQSLSFHVPLDKGNEGSGNEIEIKPVKISHVRGAMLSGGKQFLTN